jgi:hypothetical protein
MFIVLSEIRDANQAKLIKALNSITIIEEKLPKKQHQEQEQ